MTGHSGKGGKTANAKKQLKIGDRYLVNLDYFLELFTGYNADFNLCSELTAAAEMSNNSESENLNKYVYNSKF